MPSDQPAPSDDDALVGRIVGNKYLVSRLCGRGGMGSVFEAQNVAIGKRVALKFIDPDHVSNRDSVQRFLREAQAASAVESAHIVQIFDVGETDDGRPYLVMELLRGQNLGQYLQSHGTLALRDAMHIVVQTLRGLHRAHLAGIVHRDLKPENIFLAESDDDPLFVKVVDFGISKIMRRARGLDSDTITQQGVVLGTPFYMSPEQAQAMPDLDARTDLWSMGAILFECLAGRRPFPGNTYEQVIIAICTRPPPDIRSLSPDVPNTIASVIEKAMTRDRDQRFQTAAEFIDALRHAVPDLISAVPSSQEPLIQRTLPSAGVTPLSQPDPASPKTQSSWSAANAHIAKPVDAAPEHAGSKHKRRNARLVAVGLTSGLLAFVATVGWINRSRFQSADPGVAIVQSTTAASESPAPAELSLRIVTDVPEAIFYVDARIAADATVRGAPDSTHMVRVEAPGFPSVEQRIVLDGSTTEVRIDLRSAAGASSDPTRDGGSNVVVDPLPPNTGPTTASTAPRTKASGSAHETRPPVDAGPLGGGLKLKTDIP